MKKIFRNNNLLFVVLLLITSCTETGMPWDDKMLPPTYLNMGNAEDMIVVDKDNPYLKQRNDTLYYTLGVNRSGISADGEVKINLGVNNDTIANLIENGMLSNTIPMPIGMYHLPEEVSIETGKRSVEFELAVDLNKLAATPEQNFAIAVELVGSSEFKVKEDRKTTILIFNYVALLSSPTFFDDFSSPTYTSTYAELSTDLVFEILPDPENYYNDGTHAIRAPGNATTSIIYDISRIQKLIPEAGSLSGFKLKFLIPEDNPDSWFELAYRITYSAEFIPISDAFKIVSFIPELGSNSWRHVYVQGELPAGTTQLKITLKGPEAANWIPLLNSAELFYEGGYPFVLDEEINF